MNLKAIKRKLQDLRSQIDLGSYENKEEEVKSFGGRVGKYGGTIGTAKGKPFGSANVKGKLLAEFGPQGKDYIPNQALLNNVIKRKLEQLKSKIPQIRSGKYVDEKEGVKSYGGNITVGKNWIGGAIGTVKGKPFGKANISGKSIGRFGPKFIPKDE